MKLSDVIKIWDTIHVMDLGELGFCDLEKAIDEIVGIENDCLGDFIPAIEEDRIEVIEIDYSGICKKCNIPMKEGIAIENTMTGTPDFPGGEVVTLSPGGPGKVIAVLKCPECGHSVTV